MIRLFLASLSLTCTAVNLWGATVFSLFVAVSVQAQISNPATPLANATQVSLGYEHSCALTASGGVNCWGNGRDGQLGNGSRNNQLIAVGVSGLASGIQRVVSGHRHVCALTTANGVKCWGTNSAVSGSVPSEPSAVPVDVVGLESDVTALVAGGDFTCALTGAGVVKCWGSNNSGVLGDGTTNSRLTPGNVTGLSSGVVAISAGISHVCALTGQGAVKCWGSNWQGTLGIGSDWPSYQPSPLGVVGLSSGVVRIDSGFSHTCATLANGTVKCWGGNSSGQLGDGTTVNRNAPVTALLDVSTTAMAMGYSSTCAITASGGVKCWGNGNLTPLDMAGLQEGVVSLSLGSSHSCAVVGEERRVQCWGSGVSGALGHNSGQSSATPVQVIQATLPVTPTAVTATPYNSHATLSFSRTTNYNNLPDTGYTVISEPAGAEDMSAGSIATTRQIRGLLNGVGYRFYVVANNLMGQSLPSEPSATIVPMAHYYRLPTGCNLTSELTMGVTASGSLACPTSQTSPIYYRAFHSFYAEPGEQFAITIRATGFSPDVQFRDPYSIQFGYGRSFSQAGRYPSEGYITMQSGLAGIYLIEITSSSAGASGSYTITLEKNTSVSSSSSSLRSSSSVISSSESSLASSSGSSVASSSVPSSFSSSDASSSSEESSSAVSASSLISSSISSVAISSGATSSSIASSYSSAADSSVPTSSFSSAAPSSVASSVASSLANSSVAVVTSSSSTSSISCSSSMPIVFGYATNGNLTSSDCTNGARGSGYYTDRYSFYAVPGQLITISLSSTVFDTYLYLKNPAGVVIASDDDGGGNRNSRIPSNAGYFTVPVGGAGTYTIEVSSYSTVTTGSYSVLVTATAASSSSVSSSRSSSVSSVTNSSAVNPCNTIVNSPLGVTVANSLSTADCNSGARGTGYYTDRYSFSATQGQTVVVQLNSSTFDTYLYLKAPNGLVIASDDDGGGGTNSRIPTSSGVFTVSSAGTYVIEVTSYSAGRTGSYTVLRTSN